MDRTLNPAYTKALIELIDRSPFQQMLALRVSTIGVGFCTMRARVGNDHRNAFGGVHGGVYAAIIDGAGYWAHFCGTDDSVGYTSTDLNVSDLSGCEVGDALLIDAHVVKQGRTMGLAEVTIKNEKGKLLAFGTTRQLIAPGLQSIREVLATLGADALPSKYLD